MAEKDKKSELVVQDRRRFSSEGELTDTQVADEAKPEPPKPEAPEAAAPPPPERSDVPPPPSAAEQQAQHGGYQQASKKIDDMLDAAGAKRPPNMEPSFEGFVTSLYLQAMMQLGMIREENAPMRPDIVGARQTIDILGILAEKTQGNLTERESNLLQNMLFELRMAFMEITHAITTAPPPGAPEPKP